MERSSVEHLGAVAERVVERLKTAVPSKEDREIARKSSFKNVGGFALFDTAAEQKALDAMVATHRDSLKNFIDEREVWQTKLEALGIKPLAVIPSRAWAMLVAGAGLYTIRTPNGNVLFRIDAFKGLEMNQWGDPLPLAVQERWPAVLKLMFPEMLLTNSNSGNLAGQRAWATVRLPDPPKEVADVLMKLAGQTAMYWEVAAEADAISFTESIDQLREKANAAQKRLDEIRRAEEEARRRDPIIYLPGKHATVIVAQFGDFALEKKVVEDVLTRDRIPGTLSGISAEEYGATPAK